MAANRSRALLEKASRQLVEELVAEDPSLISSGPETASGPAASALPCCLAPGLWAGQGNIQVKDHTWTAAHGITHVVHCGCDEDMPRGRALVKSRHEFIVQLETNGASTLCTDMESLEDVLQFVQEARDQAEAAAAGTLTGLQRPWPCRTLKAEYPQPVVLLAGPVPAVLAVAAAFLARDPQWAAPSLAHASRALNSVAGVSVALTSKEVRVKVFAPTLKKHVA